MHVTPSEIHGVDDAAEILAARFETLVWHGCEPEHALAIAGAPDVELLDALDLVARDCPARLILPILA